MSPRRHNAPAATSTALLLVVAALGAVALGGYALDATEVIREEPPQAAFDPTLRSASGGPGDALVVSLTSGTAVRPGELDLTIEGAVDDGGRPVHAGPNVLESRVPGETWEPGESVVVNASAVRTPSGDRPAAVSSSNATVRLRDEPGDGNGTVPVFEWSARAGVSSARRRWPVRQRAVRLNRRRRRATAVSDGRPGYTPSVANWSGSRAGYPPVEAGVPVADTATRASVSVVQTEPTGRPRQFGEPPDRGAGTDDEREDRRPASSRTDPGHLIRRE